MLDRARDGVCRGNVVWNISSRSNPSYHGASAADGIYCDGAKGVLIERNIIHHADIGVELASEHANGDCSDCILRDNFIYRCRVAGLGLGGYDELRGRTLNCSVTNNTFYQNDTLRTGSGEVMLQHFLTDNVVKRNVFYAGSQSVLISNPANTNTRTVFDFNCYFARASAGDSEWMWKNADVTGFEAWKTASGQDSNSIYADPHLIDLRKFDLHLKPGSPAVMRANPASWRPMANSISTAIRA